ncbi:MAG: amino acid adenylation domain-containing protein, partial [Gammaproteobacteria bacterium]|nr:amino acid adenylation domain-containing protein [Gammaproteobacteria bacterium]
HQSLPFEKLVEMLAPDREPAMAPVFQVLFNMQNREAELPDFAGLTAAPVVVETRSAKLDLSVLVEDREDGLAVWFEYSTDLFSAATAQQMLGHYRLLLEGLLADPAQRIGEVPLLTAAERSKIINDWNATDVAYPADATLVGLLESQAAATPEAPAVRFGDQWLSYADLNARANQLAHHLRDIGVVPEQMVGVLLERSFEMVIALCGILKAGGAYVPLDPELPAARLEQMLDDAGVATVLTHSQLANRLPAGRSRIINVNIGWDAIAISNCPKRNLRPVTAPHHAAYTIFTSGSTGRPKGVVNEHRGIVNRLLWMQDTFALDATDVVLQKTPFSFDVSVWEFFWPLISGAQLVLARPGGHKDVGYLLELVQTAGVTTLHFVPSMLALFLQPEEVQPCSSIRRVISSGEALTTELQQRFFARLDAELHNLYGPTEAAVDVTWWPCNAGDTGARVPIGRPIANTRIYLVDPDNQPVPPGIPGELLIGGVQVARGYINQPELTAERFVADAFNPTTAARLYRTGDLARYRHDGVIEFLGRSDFQVKLRGVRIEPDEITAALLRVDGVTQAAVIVRNDLTDDPRLAAYYVCGADSRLTAADLRTALRQQLPDYMVPATFTELGELPVTTNGKLDRRALPRPEADAADGNAYEPPRNPLETALCEIFASVLQRSRVGIHDDFFRLGGHSLLAARTVVRISETLAKPLTLKQLFDYPTVAMLSGVVTAGTATPLPVIAPRGDTEAPPLSAAQQ